MIDAGIDRAVVAEDAGEERAAVGEARAQVVADLVLDRARPVAGLAELAEGLDLGRGPGKLHQSCSSWSQRSASIAARQPVPAEVIAWR